MSIVFGQPSGWPIKCVAGVFLQIYKHVTHKQYRNEIDDKTLSEFGEYYADLKHPPYKETINQFPQKIASKKPKVATKI